MVHVCLNLAQIFESVALMKHCDLEAIRVLLMDHIAEGRFLKEDSIEHKGVFLTKFGSRSQHFCFSGSV